MQNALNRIKEGDELIIDGYNGFVIVNPDEKFLKKYKERKIAEEEHKKRLVDLVKLDSVTKDGRKVSLLANVDFP